jgi:hypothetical protein
MLFYMVVRTERRPRRWTPGGTPARRDFNRQPLPPTPATHLLLQLKSLLEGWHLTRTERRPRRWTPGGTPARRDFNRQPLPLTPAKHLVQQRPRQSKVEPFGWGRKLQCHSVFPQTDQPGLTQLAHGEAGQYSGFAGLRQDEEAGCGYSLRRGFIYVNQLRCKRNVK